MSTMKFSKINKFIKFAYSTEFSTSLQRMSKPKRGQPIISCLNEKLNFYQGQEFGKLDNVPLASKGWNHSKACGDHFTIHPNITNFDKPSVNFQDINVDTRLIHVLNDEGVLLATDFQSEVIPVIRSGKHTLIAAETGCGKTIAYLLPIIQNLLGSKNEELNTPKALVLTPGRELAYQIGAVAQILADAVNLKVKVVVGGRTKKLMLDPEFSSIDILVTTPGVISKLSTVGIYKLNQVLYTVFDEADTLLEDSFTDRVDVLAKRLMQSQFIFTSATLPKKIPDVFQPIVENLVTIKSPRLHRPLLHVKQKFLRLTKSNRPAYLLEIAKAAKSPLVIFTNRNATCDWIALFLNERNVKCANINGSMNYNIRIEQWQKFLTGEVEILSATDVGSRGLNTTQVKHILNYDFPLYAADYIHRVGRVGRLGSILNSQITNFVSGSNEIKLVQQIEHAIRTNAEIPNVDGNINALIKKKILTSMRDTG